MKRAASWRAAARAAVLAGALAAAPAVAPAATCTVAATPIAFGIYNPQLGSPNDSTGSIVVTCLPGLLSVMQNYTLSLSPGGVGSYAPRWLVSGAAALQYQIYSDAARSTVWGNGSAGTATVHGSFLVGVVLPVVATHTLYGRLPARQTAAIAGLYVDTVLVTVSY